MLQASSEAVQLQREQQRTGAAVLAACLAAKGTDTMLRLKLSVRKHQQHQLQLQHCIASYIFVGISCPLLLQMQDAVSLSQRFHSMVQDNYDATAILHREQAGKVVYTFPATCQLLV